MSKAKCYCGRWFDRGKVGGKVCPECEAKSCPKCGGPRHVPPLHNVLYCPKCDNIPQTVADAMLDSMEDDSHQLPTLDGEKE